MRLAGKIIENFAGSGESFLDDPFRSSGNSPVKCGWQWHELHAPPILGGDLCNSRRGCPSIGQAWWGARVLPPLRRIPRESAALRCHRQARRHQHIRRAGRKTELTPRGAAAGHYWSSLWLAIVAENSLKFSARFGILRGKSGQNLFL